MRVRQKQRRLTHVFSHEAVAELTQPGPSVQDDPSRARMQFNAARVSTEQYVIGRRASNAASNTPEAQAKTHGYTQPITRLTEFVAEISVWQRSRKFGHCAAVRGPRASPRFAALYECRHFVIWVWCAHQSKRSCPKRSRQLTI